MNANSNMQLATLQSPRMASAELRLKGLGLKLPDPPKPFGTYAGAVQTGNNSMTHGKDSNRDRNDEGCSLGSQFAM